MSDMKKLSEGGACERTPITQGLRDAAMRIDYPSGRMMVEYQLDDLVRLLDAIDAVNSNLEAENDHLFEEVQRLERQHQSMAEELERVTAQRDEEAERVNAMATRCMALPADSEKRTVEIGDVMAANATPNEHWRVVGIGERGLIFLSTGAHINAGVCHHVSEPESIAYAARELESLGTRRGFRNAKEFYEALHQLVTRVVDLCEERDDR